MGKSIIQTDKQCFLCGRETCLERHHVFAGTANRRISEREGFWLWLCHDCHTGAKGAQYEKETNLLLKREAQMAYEATHTREEWMKLIRKNYLEG